MVLVDTNIVGNLLLHGAKAPAARALYARDADWRTEPLLFVELTNVLATAMRVAGMSIATARTALDHAHRMLDEGLERTLDADVLAVAARHGVSGYDARFLCAAMALGTRLVTEDAALRLEAPAWTRSLDDALAA
jgi:predicted nucleic acid-binding protein